MSIQIHKSKIEITENIKSSFKMLINSIIIYTVNTKTTLVKEEFIKKKREVLFSFSRRVTVLTGKLFNLMKNHKCIREPDFHRMIHWVDFVNVNGNLKTYEIIQSNLGSSTVMAAVKEKSI